MQSKESRDKYSRDWQKLSLRLRERAGHRCEQCGAKRGEFRNRDTNELMSEESYIKQRENALHEYLNAKRKHTYINEAYKIIYDTTGKLVNLNSGCSGKKLYETVLAGKDYSHMVSSFRITIRTVKVVIQVHHKDEDPSNDDESNLICLCGHCHLLNHDRQL